MKKGARPGGGDAAASATPVESLANGQYMRISDGILDRVGPALYDKEWAGRLTASEEYLLEYYENTAPEMLATFGPDGQKVIALRSRRALLKNQAYGVRDWLRDHVLIPQAGHEAGYTWDNAAFEAAFATAFPNAVVQAAADKTIEQPEEIGRRIRNAGGDDPTAAAEVLFYYPQMSNAQLARAVPTSRTAKPKSQEERGRRLKRAVRDKYPGGYKPS